jgi:hypothetical protein
VSLRSLFSRLVSVFFLLALLAWIPPVAAEEISPAQGQEYAAAREALQAARSANAEMYAPEPMKQAHDLLAAAENARDARDGLKFAHLSRLARAQAELARAGAELRTEEERLNTVKEELQKAIAHLQRLRKSQ